MKRLLVRGQGVVLPCIFLKIEKIALILEKAYPDCVHLWIKFVL